VPTDVNEPRHRRITFATHVLPAVVYGGGIFYAGLIKIGPLPEGPVIATDKLLHALAFGALGLLIARAAHWLRPRATLAKKLVLGGVGSSALGLWLEVCQAFTSYRSADLWDWLADTVGALLALGLAFVLLTWVPRRVHG